MEEKDSIVILVTISDDRFGRKNGKYSETQDQIERLFRANPSFGIKDFLMLKWSQIETSQFFQDNKQLLSHTDAAVNGRAYKPYAILEAFNKVNEGDYIVYTDCSPEMWKMQKGFKIDPEIFDIKVLKNLCKNNDDVLSCFVKWKDKHLYPGELGIHTHRHFTTNRCMDKMDLRFYEDAYMHASGMMVFRKTNETKAFIEEWLKWNLIDECCALGPARIGGASWWNEEEDFKLGHRHDQSISGLLLNAKNQKLIDIVYNEINPYNFLQYARKNQEYKFIESLPEIKEGDKVLNKSGTEMKVWRIDLEGDKKRYIVGQLSESCYGCGREELKLI